MALHAKENVTELETMPFYLVTTSTLIEAEDEKAAAHETIAKIRAGNEVNVCVKADETRTTYLTVAAKPVKTHVPPTEDDAPVNEVRPAEVKEESAIPLLKRVLLPFIATMFSGRR